MKYLLDTCVISELIKKRPNKRVINLVDSNDEHDYYLSVLTFGEIHKGIEKQPDVSRKKKLHLWVENDLKERFKNKIIPIDLNVSIIWGQIQGKAESEGKPMPAIDGLIAATGLAYNLTVVTRNVADMQQSGVAVLNPWELM